MALGPANYAAHVAGGLIRSFWPDENLIEEVINEEPLLGTITKQTDWNDAARFFPLGWGSSEAVARTFAASKRMKSAAKQQRFELATGELFQTLSLEGKLMRSAEFGGRKAAAHLAEPLKREGSAAIDAMKRYLSKAVHGNGVGVIGRIASTSNLSSTTISLTDSNDLKNFPIDCFIEAEHTGATGGTVFDGEEQIVSKGTEDSPTLTIGQNWADAFPGIAVGDYLYRSSFYDNDVFAGFDAFNPLHTGSPGTFKGANRNLSPEWLAGFCMSATNVDVFQAIKKGARRLHDNGGKPKVAFMSTRTYEKFEFQLATKVVMDKQPAAKMGSMELGISYDCIVIQGPRGPIKCFASSWMPDDIIRVGDPDTLVMGSIGPLVHWDMGNGPTDLRTEDQTDNRELRAVSDPVFVNKAPGRWIRIAI